MSNIDDDVNENLVEQVPDNKVENNDIVEKEDKSDNLAKITLNYLYLAIYEFVGIFFFVTCICFSMGSVNKFIFGFWVVLVFFSNYSGGHVNPAVTLGFYIYDADWGYGLIKLALYWVAQILGSAFASKVSFELLNINVFVAVPEASSTEEVFFSEFMFTGTFVFVILYVCSKVTAPANTSLPTKCLIIIGWFYCCIHMGARLSGSAFNPAILFTINGWAYMQGHPKAMQFALSMMFAELLGAAAFTLCFKYIFEKNFPGQQIEEVKVKVEVEEVEKLGPVSEDLEKGEVIPVVVHKEANKNDQSFETQSSYSDDENKQSAKKESIVVEPMPLLNPFKLIQPKNILGGKAFGAVMQRRARVASRMESRNNEQTELLKNNDIDHTERFLTRACLYNLKSLPKKTILTIKFFKVNENLFKSSLIEPVETIKVEGNLDYFAINKVLEYNYFDNHQFRVEIETTEGDKKVYNINLFAILQNNLNPIKLPIDFTDKEVVYNYDNDNHIKDNIPYLLINFQRKTKVLNFCVYTFFVEFTLDKIINTTDVRKLSYKCFIKNKGELSTKLFESKQILSKKKFIFNMAFIKRSDLYGNSNDETELSFEIIQEEKVLGEAIILFKKIKNFKLNEINSIDVVSPDDNTTSEGKLKIIQRELNPSQLYDEVIQGFQFKFALAFDLSTQFADSEINTAYTNILSSLKKVIPFYNVKDIPLYGIGVTDKTNTQYLELNMDENTDQFELSNVMKTFDDVKNPKGLSPGKQSIGKFLKSLLQQLKDNEKAYEYTIFVIMINDRIEDEQLAKDMFVQLSKFPISFIVIGFSGKENAYSKFGFLTTLRYDDDPKSQLENSEGELRERPNVNFIRYNYWEEDTVNSLIQAEFEKIPTQIEEYFTLHKKKDMK